MSKRGQSGVDSPIAFSPVHTRRSSGKKGKEQKDCLQSDSSENAVKEPLNKRQRQNETKEERVVARRPRTRSFNLDVAVPLTRSEAVSKNKVKEKNQGEPSRCIRGTKKKRDGDSPRQVATAVRRSERESRKVFDSLNEHTLVRTLVGDYLVERKSGSSSKRRPLLEEGETDSQEEQPGYVSMYDMIKNKGKSDKSDGEDDEDNEEKGSDDDNSSDENEEEEDDDDVTPQQRYTLRQNKPVTKRYTAPPLKEYHSSRRGLFSRHMRERECSRKEPFSPVRKSYKLKRKTINESSTSTDDDDEDNRKFERRKAKSMAKARNRCLPMNLGLEDLSKGTLADRERIGSSLADVDPMNVDRSITFDSIGGLGKHVRSLKEMVVFPLLYPEVFDKFKVNPPRGVLFHGPPGTGKTLMARALANECSQEGKRVAFFMRKGADCLSKWVGESERQLRLLFDQAFKMRPSIIFFDEIDGLAPVRSSRQDQIHSSIVSTLLALMDGLDNRGEIVVIGATNRIDSIDPALRRPGRFDREFIFPLPDKNARRSILTIHTKAWQPRLTQGFINEVADQCVGYCGADIKALCTEAALFALRRRYPQIYASKKKLVLDVNTVRVSAKDFVKGIKTIVPACQRAVVSPGRTLSCTIRPLLCEIFSTALAMVTKIFPPAVCKTVGESSPGSSVNNFAVSDTESSDDGTDDDDIYELDPSSSEGARAARAARAARRAGLKGSTNEAGNRFHSFAENPLPSKNVHRPRYLVCGRQGMCQSTHVSPAILHSMEHLPVHCLDLPALFGCASKTPEEACAQVFREARRVAPSIIYLPRIESLWNTTTDTLKATFLSLVNDLPPSMPLLLFATSDQPASRLPRDLSWLFSIELDQVFEVQNPSAKERWAYFEPLFLTEAVKLPCLSKKTKSKKPLEVLAVASPPTPRELNANELQKVREDEENTLRELRIFLREITVKLMSDRKFKEFYKPVDLEEVPDYLDVIKDPMDLSTMLQKVDGHQYLTCGEYLNDIDLITSNALEYNPNQDPLDRIIRHRACALKDCAHSLIKSQLDVDFEKACEEIAASRKRRGDSRNVLAPKFLPVAPAQSSSRTDGAAVAASTDATQKASGSAQPTRASRRVRGLSASVDIPLEYLPIKSIPSSSRLSAVESKVSLEEGADSVKKISNKRRRRGGRRIRRSKTSAVRKATPSKFILEPEHSGPEVEPEHSEPGVEPENFKDYNDAGDTGEVKAVKGDDVQLADEEEKEKNESNEREHNGIDEYGENEESENEGDLGVNDKEDEDKKRDDKLNEKDSVEDEDEMSPEETTEKCNDDDKQQENCLENETELKNKSASEDGESLESGSVPDSCTKNYINSLHVRSEVKSALRFRLDSLNCEHDVREETDRHLNGKDKESLSENNFSLATSELSNCDSKDFAELESMLSTSPLPVNGVAMLDDAATTKTFAESTIMANGDHSLPEKRISGGDKLVVNSDEKSKRVLFTDKSEIHEITSEDSDPDIEMSSPEPSQEDRGRFEAILMNLVEMTKDVTIETLERYHSSIRQCILQHKKDDSRQPLLADLKSLLAKFEALNSNSST